MALEPSRIVNGPAISRFENAVVEYLGTQAAHAVAVSSGTAAVHLALLTGGVRPGDDVLMPSLTYVAPANAVRYTGASPVFLDAEPTYRQLDVERAADFAARHYERRSGETRHRWTGRRLAAILNIGLLGHPSDFDAVSALGANLGVPVIDDAAEVLGAACRGRRAGGVAELSALSFNANKVITSAGGGMVVCQEEASAQTVRSLASHARSHPTHYLHDAVGFNYSMPTSHAALGFSQLERIDGVLAAKRRIAAHYKQAFSGRRDVVCPKEASWATASYWMYTVQVPQVHRNRVVAELAAGGIETRPIFAPMHRVAAHEGSLSDDCRVADDLGATGLCLPCSASISAEEIAEVAQALTRALDRA